MLDDDDDDDLSCAFLAQEVADRRNVPSLLIGLFKIQLHWLVGSFIQQLPVNKPCCQAPSYPPPLLSGDLHVTFLRTRTIALSPLERVSVAFSGALASQLKEGFN